MLDTVGCALHVCLHAAQHGLLGPEPQGHGCRTGDDLSRAMSVFDDATWRRAAQLARDLLAEPAFAFGMRLDAEGAVVARRIGLTEERPNAAFFPGRFFATPGEGTWVRLLEADTVRQRLAVLRPFVRPSPGRRNRSVRSALGRRFAPLGYLEHWLRLVPHILPALRAARRDRPTVRRPSPSTPDSPR